MSAQNQAIAATDAETAVLGALLLDNSAYDRICDTLKVEHFFSALHRDLYAEITTQIASGRAVDVITVGQKIPSKITLQELNAIAQFVPSSANIRRYAETIIERSKSRDLLAVSAAITELAVDHEKTIDERVDLAQGQLAKLIDESPRDDWVSAYTGMMQHMDVIEARETGKVRAWPTGLIDLDSLLEGGHRPGELVIIGARPSMGKTALGMTIGLFMSEVLSVGMLSMEMPHTELRDRKTAILGRVSLSLIKNPQKENCWDKIVEGVERSKQLNFYASDQGGLNINQVRSKARALKRLHGLDVLIVDYIGLMTGLDARQQRAYQLEEISRGLKTLAKELNIAVLCLAQVNRKVEERTDSMPGLSDLRDSGAIEQDADIVMFVHRPIQQKPELGGDWVNYAKLRVAKNRQGRCGDISLFYQGDQTRFDNWSGQPPSSGGGAPSRKGFAG